MSLAVFPSNVRGLTYPVDKGAGFNTLVQSAPNELETRIAQTYNPIWNWELIYEFLFDEYASGKAGLARLTDYRLLQGFFMACGGQATEFLYDDPTDDYVGPGVVAGLPNTPMAQLSVMNDGAGTYYSPVQRNMGGQFLEDVTDLRGEIVSYGNATGSVTWNESRSIAWNFEAVLWGNFALASTAAALPSDAVIQGIYPVFIGSATFASVTDMAFKYGTGMSLTVVPSGNDFISPSNPDNSSFSSTEFYGASIGTSLSALAGQEILGITNCSLNLGPPMTDRFDVTAVAYAILYTSATPVTDAQMPPPFAVPAGQGLAWAIPSSVSYTGPTGAQGTATGSAAAAITTPIKVYDAGVLQVAGTDYLLMGPGLAIPGNSYMGMYLKWLHTPVGPVTADFYFYFRVRFQEDEQSFSQFLAQFWTAGGADAGNSASLKLRSSRPVQV